MATSDTNVKLSNVIGAPFSDYVLLQLYINRRFDEHPLRLLFL
jgi:hypothetical protein